MVRLTMTVCLLLAALAGAPVRAEPYDDLKGRPYDEARAVLISRGISPVRVSHDDAPWACVEGRCEAYPEVLDCAGAGTGGCTFAFWNGRADEPLVVITSGEVDPRVAVIKSPSPEDRATIFGERKTFRRAPIR